MKSKVIDMHSKTIWSKLSYPESGHFQLDFSLFHVRKKNKFSFTVHLFSLGLFTEWACPVQLHHNLFPMSFIFSTFCFSLSNKSLSPAFNNLFIKDSSLNSSLALSFSPLWLKHSNMGKSSVLSKWYLFWSPFVWKTNGEEDRNVLVPKIRYKLKNIQLTESLGLQKQHVVIYFNINQFAFTLRLNCAGLIFQRKL